MSADRQRFAPGLFQLGVAVPGSPAVVVPLDSVPFVIGRSPQCSCIVGAPGVWERHLRFEFDPSEGLVATAEPGAIVLHGNKKTSLGTFHLRQALGLMISAVVCWVAVIILAFIPIIGWLTGVVLWLGLFVLWLMGFISAASGQKKPVPVLGEHFQKWFAGAFD